MKLIWETIKIVVLALMIVIPIRYFLFQPFVVSGQSMEPNFHQGDYLIVDAISYRFRDPKRGEVVVFNYPQSPNFRHIKRIIGLPGETLKIDDQGVKLFSNGEYIILDETSYISSNDYYQELKIILKEDEYFVMGDNRPLSFDSRRWGSLPRENIIGRFALRLFPVARAQKAEIPSY